MNIRTSKEGKRGCGYRQPGGIYLVTEGLGRYCGALPIELSVCPCCHHGIKPCRGWTWINLAQFAAAGALCRREDGCGNCPIADAVIQDVGLLWVGEKFYTTTRDFTKEADKMGISRRIHQVPKKFKIGETWVALAHRRAIEEPFKLEDGNGKGKFKPGIFHLFKPTRIEYIVKQSDSQEKLQRLEDRGFTLVKVVRAEQKEELLTV
jgi:hypothetical protein